ncbi:hypothetical protein MTO96_017580 [Rhipicephalus appendiculatus]
MLFKKFDEGKNILDKEVTSENIQTFFQLNSMPLVVEYTHENARDVFGGLIQQHSLLFFSKERSDFKDVLENFREAAAAFRHQVLFTSIDVDDADQDRILGFFDLEKDQVPTLRFLKFEHDIALFKPEANSLKAEDIKAFVQGALDGTIKQIRLSQDLPGRLGQAPGQGGRAEELRRGRLRQDQERPGGVLRPRGATPTSSWRPSTTSWPRSTRTARTCSSSRWTPWPTSSSTQSSTSCLTFELYKKETNEVVKYSGERTLEGLSEFIDTNGEFDQAPPEEIV